MKFVWFTPAAAQSAIGRMSKLVIHELVKQGDEVVVVRSENTERLGLTPHPFDVEMITWRDNRQVSRLIDRADAIIYHVGNNFDFHRGCLEWMPRASGVVCLHDYFLGHLFAEWLHNLPNDLADQEAVAILSSWYGDKVAKNHLSALHSTAFIEATCGSSPMTEWVASMASGVVTHSNWDIERILKACGGPVEVVPLAYDGPSLIKSDRLDGHGLLRQNGSANGLHVLTIGHVNKNKRPESVIRAIGRSEKLKKNVFYHLIGLAEPSYAEVLSTLARSLEVRLVIHGEVGEQALSDSIRESDVMCCLRWPALESASASAIEAMLYGKPTIVTDTGFYRGLPDEGVLKVKQEDELVSLQKALESLLDNPEARIQLGDRAQRYARATFTAANYAAQVKAMSKRVAATSPILDSTRHIGKTLANWGGLNDERCLQEIAAPLKIFENPSTVSRD